MIVNSFKFFNDLMARPKRFELLTPRFVVWCSIQLSYGRATLRQCQAFLAGSVVGGAE